MFAKKILVVDGVCGMGKTTSIVEKIKEITLNKKKFNKEDQKVIFATPYREECMKMAKVESTEIDGVDHPVFNGNRVKYIAKPFNFNFSSYLFSRSESKSNNSKILQYIRSNRNIVITHEALSRFTDKIINSLREYNYNLIIDEVPNVVSLKDDVAEEVSLHDLYILKKIGVLVENKSGKISWKNPNVTLEQYSKLNQSLKRGDLFYLRDSSKKPKRKIAPKAVFVHTWNSDLFIQPNSVYIYTYLFEGSYCNAYFKMKKLSWDFENRTEKEFVYNPNIYNYDLLIKLYNPKDLKHEMFKIKKSFSKSWYDKIAKYSGLKMKEGFYEKESKSMEKDPFYPKKESEYLNDIELLVTKTNSFMKNKYLKPSEDLIQENNFLISQMKAAGLRDDDSKIMELKEMLDEEEVVKEDRLWSTFKAFSKLLIPEKGAAYGKTQFLSYNQKATNSFRHVKKMAYLVNVYPHPDLITFFSQRGIEIKSDQYAISEMIQWVFRSRIRSGKKIELFIASHRMRELFKQWMQDIKRIREDRLEEINSFPTTYRDEE